MWFTEDPWPPVLIAGLGALVCLALWNSSRRNVHLVLALVLVLLCGVIYLAERAIVTEGERLQKLVVELCDDFRNKNAGTVDYFSDTAPELKALVAEGMAWVEVRNDLRLTDFQTAMTHQNSRAIVHFRANGTITVVGYGDVGHQPARFLLTFQREKGQWKIIEVERLHPLTGRKMGILDKSAG